MSSAAATRLRRVAGTTLACLAVLGATAGTSAAAGHTTNRTVRVAFSRLQSQLHGELLATARRARSQRAHHHSCRALHTLDDLRIELRHQGGSHVHGVSSVQLAIAGTPGGAHCAIRSRRSTVPREPLIVGGPLKPEKRVKEKRDESEGIPPPPVRKPGSRFDAGPPTTVTPASASPALGPFHFSTLTDVGSPTEEYIPEEPSQASAGKVVWYTQNTGAAFSLDGGRTFSQVDTREMFPEVGHPFCCDQIVLYSPQINRFIWYIQYDCKRPDAECEKSKSTNFVRVVVASPEAIVANRDEPAGAWKSWIITPRDFGQRHGMLDYPDIGLGRHSLYITSNFFGSKDGSVVGRVSLRRLKAGRSLSLRYYRDPNNDAYRIAQGADTRGFLASNASATKLRTLAWDEGSPLIFAHRTPHTANTSFDYRSKPNGVDWGARNDDAVNGATRRGNELWFAWSEGRSRCSSRCDGDHPKLKRVWPQPHVHVAVVDSRSFHLVKERFIHNPGYAIGYPSLATDSRQRVGMVFSYGGGLAGNPSPAAGYLTGGEQFRQVVASAAPGSQGDYVNLRRDWPDRSRFTASGYIHRYDSPGTATPHWLFYRYSR